MTEASIKTGLLSFKNSELGRSLTTGNNLTPVSQTTGRLFIQTLLQKSDFKPSEESRTLGASWEDVGTCVCHDLLSCQVRKSRGPGLRWKLLLVPFA